MSQDGKGSVSSYDEAMDALSSLITKRTRADKNNSGDRFELLYDYVKRQILLSEEANDVVPINEGKISRVDKRVDLTDGTYSYEGANLTISTDLNPTVKNSPATNKLYEAFEEEDKL